MQKLLILLIGLFPALSHAHNEHGHSLLDNLSHVLSSPEHVWPLTLGLVLVVAVVISLNKRK